MLNCSFWYADECESCILKYGCLILTECRYPGERAYNDACRELVTKYEYLRDHHCINGPNFVSKLVHYFIKIC